MAANKHQILQESYHPANVPQEARREKLRRVWKHYKIMVWKNLILFRRSYLTTFMQFMTPFLICTYLWILQNVVDLSAGVTVKDPQILDLSKIPKCYGEDCITVGIGLTSGMKEWVDFIIHDIAQSHNLQLDRDIKIISHQDPLNFVQFLTENENKTQTGVIFCTGAFNMPISPYLNRIECPMDGDELFSYNILSNNSFSEAGFLQPSRIPMPYDIASLSLKVAIDQAIGRYQARRQGLPDPEIELEMQRFPSVKNRYVLGNDIITTSGVFYFFIPPMIPFVVILSEILREKENKLRQGMCVMGMSHNAYWLGWFTNGVLYTLIISNVMIFSGYLYDFDFFTKTPYLILLMLFWFYSMSIMIAAMFLSTVIKTTNLGYTVAYAIILVGLVIQIFLGNLIVFYALYSEGIPWWAFILRYALLLYPPFNFSQAFTLIVRRSGKHFALHKDSWVPGRGFWWSDLVKSRHGHLVGHFSVPPVLFTFGMMLVNCLLYGMLTWLFDWMLPENRGGLTSVKQMFRGCCKRRLREVRNVQIEMSEIDVRDPVYQEREKVIKELESDEQREGLRIVGLDKIFFSKFWSCRDQQAIHAVNDVHLKVQKDELLALLGHNGAGKSTLIGLITGILPPTNGTMHLNDLDMFNNMKEIRQNLGVCPQHDILWQELTAREHLIIFAKLKEVQDVDAEVSKQLEYVNLHRVADHQVGTFSGGMKRRLSVAICAIGNPKLLIFDEPTTGMDPINRRQIWNLISRIKKGRTVILTTHSMEEADALSDRVAIICGGRIRCLGTALYLKTQFGEGYRIMLVSKDTSQALQLAQQILTSSKVVDIKGGSIMLSVPFSEIEQIVNFASLMESEEDNHIKMLIDDWTISNTTLEEVFIRVTNSN